MERRKFLRNATIATAAGAATAGASGSALALPAWIEFMASALKDVPVQEVPIPEGVVQVDGEWRYAEWADGGFVRSLGLDGNPITPALAVRPSAQFDVVAPGEVALPQ